MGGCTSPVRFWQNDRRRIDRCAVLDGECKNVGTRTEAVHTPAASVLVEETRDHVFPRSWYPETTPGEIQRWTVPCCATCNNKLGRMEREVFTRLALCVDPRKAEVAGLSAKAMRSMGIGVEGLGAKEAEQRRAQKLKVIRSTVPYKAGIETLPGMGPHPGFPEEKINCGSTFQRTCCVAVAERKWIRGCSSGVSFLFPQEAAPFSVVMVVVLALGSLLVVYGRPHWENSCRPIRPNKPKPFGAR